MSTPYSLSMRPDGELFAKSDDVLPIVGPEPIPELNPRGIDSRVSEKLPADGTYLLAVSNIALPNLTMHPSVD